MSSKELKYNVSSFWLSFFNGFILFNLVLFIIEFLGLLLFINNLPSESMGLDNVITIVIGLSLLSSLFLFTIILYMIKGALGRHNFMKNMVGSFIARTSNTNPLLLRLIGIIGSILIIISSITYYGCYLDPENTTLLTIIGYIVLGLGVIFYLGGYKEAGGVKACFLSMLLLASTIILLYLAHTIPWSSINVLSRVYISFILMSMFLSLFVMGIILIGVGLEIIIDKTESYAFGTSYTLMILILAIYIIQSLTIYSTISILADIVKNDYSLLNSFTLSIDYIDRMGLLLISPKVLFLIFFFIGISSLVGFLLVKIPRKHGGE